MTRLIVFLSACFASTLATNYGGYDEYGAGGMTANKGSEGSGQGEDGSAGAQGLSADAGGANAETIKISINIIAKGQGGRTSLQDLGESAMPVGKTHHVTVGGSAGKVYTPDSLVAEPKDMVLFYFLSKNHTVTQSSFAKPCIKSADGADSGFMPNGDETLNPPPTFQFQVLDKKPIWFYCKQEGHCGKGMVFSINPTAEKSQAKFKQMAIEQNQATDGSYGAKKGSASPSVIPVLAAGTGVIAPSGTAPAATGGIPSPTGNSTVYSAPSQPPSQQNNAAPPTGGASGQANLVQGTGSAAAGQCQCSCLCGVAPFPVGAGVGMWGGMSGSIPA